MSANEYGVVVDSCPLSEVKTREAASRLNCSVDENGRSRYVCVPNQDLSALVEFCYTKTIVGLYQAGNCLKMIGNGFLDKISCKNFLEGCPADHFRSTDLFQYPACHRLNTDKRCFLLDPTCSPKTNETEQNSEFGKEGAIIAVTVSVLILMLLIILTIACVLWRRRKRKNRNENRGI
ncbi:uncharacterized protein LOC134261624 [Saccostrea cucullata]|uniref:uncharacterized protein LOC134261624 n=1 Tax=Saccostrea cuccullata TaxID=36930 RepID=UPI002ED53370